MNEASRSSFNGPAFWSVLLILAGDRARPAHRTERGGVDAHR